jgi:hypothetical protein
MHATPPAVAPPSTIVQRRQIALVALAALVAFAAAFGIGKALSSGGEATAAPERPQAIEVSAVAVAAGQPSAGAIPGLKDPARKPAAHHKAKPKPTTTNAQAQTQTQQSQPQQQQQQAAPRTTTPPKQTPATKKEPTITSGGGEE